MTADELEHGPSREGRDRLPHCEKLVVDEEVKLRDKRGETIRRFVFTLAAAQPASDGRKIPTSVVTVTSSLAFVPNLNINLHIILCSFHLRGFRHIHQYLDLIVFIIRQCFEPLFSDLVGCDDFGDHASWLKTAVADRFDNGLEIAIDVGYDYRSVSIRRRGNLLE